MATEREGLLPRQQVSTLLRSLRYWGPAWLVMMADVDAASVITAAESGALYGTRLVWFLLALTIPLYVIQEVSGRVGAVTHKGLGELIRENYSGRLAMLAAIPMALVDVISYAVEYTGAAIGFQMLGVPPWLSVPAVFAGHLLLVYKRKYAQAERPLLVFSVFFALAWGLSAFWRLQRGIEFTPLYFSTAPHFWFIMAANVGAVIMPFMLFYQTAATAEKGTTVNELKGIRLETAVGALFSELLMVAIVIATVGLRSDALDFASPHVLANGLSAVAGSLAPWFFGIGLIAASFIALIVVSLGSCWGVTEALGWGRQNWFKVYLIESLPAVLVPMLTLNLVHAALNLMVLQIIVLLGPATILGLIAADRRLMGEQALSGFNRIVYWLFLALVVATGIISLASFGLP